MAFLVAANTSPALGHSDGIVQLLEEPALPAKILTKSSVINTPPMGCAVGKRFGSRMSLLHKVRGASWKAAIKWSCERAGRRHRVFWFLSALDLLFKVYFILWDRKSTRGGGGLQPSSATAFFHQWRISASDTFLATLSPACIGLRSLAVVQVLPAVSCVLEAPKASGKPF